VVRRCKPTDQQKTDANDFYNNARAAESIKPDVPASDLDVLFRREAGLPTDDAKYYAARPSRDTSRYQSLHGCSAHLQAPQPRTALQLTPEVLNGQLAGRERILEFVRAGNAAVTVVSRSTGTRFTYQFQRPKDWTPTSERPVAPTFCKVMTGPDNNEDFTFVGTMWPEDGRWPDGAQVYRHSAKSRISVQAPSVKALVWFLRTALAPKNDAELAKCEVWHEGRCGRCGRKLTVPSSVASGYGPECEGRMA